jgi:hypothetical protein
MKFIFKYWNNKVKWHGECLFSYESETIVEANKAFQEKTGLNVVKSSWISVSQQELLN